MLYVPVWYFFRWWKTWCIFAILKCVYSGAYQSCCRMMSLFMVIYKLWIPLLMRVYNVWTRSYILKLCFRHSIRLIRLRIFLLTYGVESLGLLLSKHLIHFLLYFVKSAQYNVLKLIIIIINFLLFCFRNDVSKTVELHIFKRIGVLRF